MAEMVPEQIVRPASPIADPADMLPPLDDEATFHQTERLLSRGDPFAQASHICHHAHRIDEPELTTSSVGYLDHSSCLGITHADRNLDEGMLAVLEGLDGHRR